MPKASRNKRAQRPAPAQSPPKIAASALALAAPAAPSRDALSYRIEDAIALTGIGRTTLYQLAGYGNRAEKPPKLRFIKVRGRTLVDGDSLRSLLQQAAAA